MNEIVCCWYHHNFRKVFTNICLNFCLNQHTASLTFRKFFTNIPRLPAYVTNGREEHILSHSKLKTRQFYLQGEVDVNFDEPWCQNDWMKLIISNNSTLVRRVEIMKWFVFSEVSHAVFTHNNIVTDLSSKEQFACLRTWIKSTELQTLVYSEISLWEWILF